MVTAGVLSAVLGIGIGAAVGVAAAPLLGGLAVWLIYVLRTSVDLTEQPVASNVRLLAGAMVGSAAAVGVLGLDRAALGGWWMQLAVSNGALLLGSVAIRTRQEPRRVIVVGHARPVQHAISTWPDSPAGVLCGAVVVPQDRADISRTDTILTLVEETSADIVLCFTAGLDEDEIRTLGWQLEDTHVRIAVSSAVGHAAPSRVHLSRIGGRTVSLLGPSRPDLAVRAIKSALDRLAAAVMLLVLSPLLLALGVAVRLDSPGPAIFRQVRVGHRGRPFTMFKLRTMVADAEGLKASLDNSEGNGLLFKQRNDPRVTRVGDILRRTSLDEIPQLINVLKGEMSLVGPRPALPDEVAQYSWLERRRLAVTPGITGAWQVGG
ncbi:MAG: sugar transferase, partial [Nocardioides sp.]